MAVRMMNALSRRTKISAVIAAVLAQAGCEEDVPIDAPEVTVACAASTAAPARRLTQPEYVNVVRDLLGVDATPSWPADASSLGFDNQVEAQPLGFQHVEGMLRTAEEVAAAVDVSTVVPCAPSEIGDDACGSMFVERFGRLAYRRDLTPDELAGMGTLFAEALADRGFDAAIRTVIETVLQSTSFHYRFERGTGDPDADGLVALDGFELASRLSFFLWASAPDEALLDAAASGALADPAGLRAEAERMLGDARARRGLGNFVRQWLRLDRVLVADKSDELFPEFDSDVAAELVKGAIELASYVTFDAPVGDLEALYTTNVVAVTTRTAPIFGVEPPQGSGYALVAAPEGQRFGVLTAPAILAGFAKPDESSPIARAVFIREALLCQPLPSPPEGVLIEPPPFDPTLTTRQRFAQHATDPACAGCHRLIDQLGFPLEGYDAIGRFRTEENGIPIDGTGQLDGAEDASGPLSGPGDLAQVLASSDVGRRCFVTQLTRYAIGRTETEGEACGVDALSQELEPGTPIRSILASIVTRPSFLRRPVVVPGECQ
jgi:hypothetical protein